MLSCCSRALLTCFDEFHSFTFRFLKISDIYNLCLARVRLTLLLDGCRVKFIVVNCQNRYLIVNDSALVTTYMWQVTIWQMTISICHCHWQLLLSKCDKYSILLYLTSMFAEIDPQKLHWLIGFQAVYRWIRCNTHTCVMMTLKFWVNRNVRKFKQCLSRLFRVHPTAVRYVLKI